MHIKEFGKRLKGARIESKMSQRSLGLALGLSDKTISSYESSRSYPNLEVLAKISTILGKSMEYFVSSQKEIFIEDYLKKVLDKQQKLSEEVRKLEVLIKREE
jgi:transcriptional regulator with XRE-family HTH domain